MKTLIQRFKTETPIFWKKVRGIMVIIGTISGALIAAPGVPAIIITIAGYGVTVGVVGTILSSLTTV